MTSLANQLKRLALPQNDPSLLSRKEVDSLLFDPKEAATIDRDTFFAIGCTGLEELLGIEPCLEEFQDTLFSQASKGLERSVQTKEVNKQLDVGISLFLTRLSPYFMLKPAQKCLEWLIHRFHIHLYNEDSLIACALPYHETKVFVRVIQLLRISAPTHRWHWLHPVKKAGVPLARSTLITHCYKDLSFLDFICSLVTKSVKAYSGFSGNCAQLRVVFSFYASTIVPALDAVANINDSLVAKLLPCIQKGLKSSLMDYKAASYMIVCQLAVKVVMEPSLVNTLAVQVCKSLSKDPTLPREGLGCLIVLVQNQKENCLEKKTYTHLCGIPDLVSRLQEIAAVHDISPLLRYLLPHLVHYVVAHGGELQAEDSVNFEDLLGSVLQSLPLDNGLDHVAAKILLQEYIYYGKKKRLTSIGISSLNQRLLPFVRTFESKCPGALDSILEGHLTDTISGKEEQNLFHQFITLSTSSGKYKILADVDTSLLLSLNHPLPVVRILAVKHLKMIIGSRQEGFDEAFLREAVLGRMKDDVPEVVLTTLQALEVYAGQLGHEETVSCLLALFQRVDLSKNGNWCAVLKEAVRMLDDMELIQGCPDVKARVVMELLPFLPVTSPYPESPEQQISNCITSSKLLSQHPLIHGWDNAYAQVLASTHLAHVMGVANQELISILTRNLSAMEASTKHHTIDDLIAIAGSRTSSVRDRATFMILAYTLVHSLESISAPQHLETAVKVYDLLEPKLHKLVNKGLTEEFGVTGYPELYEGHFPPVDLMKDFLENLQMGSKAEKEHCALLAGLLRMFISALRCTDPAFKGKTWWNPETLDAPTSSYLRLLCKIFDVTLTGASQAQLAGSFRALTQLLFQMHFRDPRELFKFLSLLWGYSANLSDQLGCRVSAVLQTQALYMGRALLAAQPRDIVKQLASASSPVPVSLLVCVNSPLREVRRAGAACLQALVGADSSPFGPVVEKLVQATEEITADPSHISQALGHLFKELPAPGKGKSGDGKLAVALQQLLHCAQDPECPSYTAKGLLRVLKEVNGEEVLSVLLPAMDRLLEKCGQEPPQLLKDEALLLQLLLGKYNEWSAPLLARDPRCTELLVRALHSSRQPYQRMPSFQILALEQITKPFFATLADEIQQKLLGVIFDLLVECKSPACAQAVNGVFKAIAVDGEQVANELVPADKPKASGTVQQARRQKMQQQRKSSAAETTADRAATYWQRVTLILELLQHKKKLKRPQMLVPALFTLLSRCLERVGPEHSNVEYTKQLVLGCLLNTCHKLSPEGGPVSKDVLEEEKFNVELIVQCVRCSDMPQTHHHSLLLLGAVAGMFPEKVLHNIMPIFTFMGANIMRLDDTYSFQVINRTVQTVIPALIKAHEGGSSQSTEDMETVVTRIVHVFVDALPHVPEHRRLPILSQLVGTLGPQRFLWVLLLLLFKQHATSTATSSAEKDAVLERDVEFWISICCEFEVQDQLASLVKVLKYLTTLPEDKDEGLGRRKSTRRKTKKDEAEDLMFSVEAHSGKELRHFKFLSVSFMAQLLASHTFVGKVANCDEAQQERLQSFEQSLLEEVLRYINSVAHCVEENSDKATAKFWRALLNKSYDVLDKVNALLPTDTFIPVMRGLMGNQLPSVRRKAMDLLNNKLQQKVHWQEGQVELMLELTGELLAIAGRGQQEQEQAINRQTALYSLKLLCRSFGAAHQEAFVPVLRAAVDLVTAEGEERNVMGSALLCIAEVTSTLKALAVPQLPRLMPAVLMVLSDRKELLSSEIYLLSAVTALQKVTETLPHFISPYLQVIAVEVTHLTRVVEKASQFPQLGVRLASLRLTLATKLPPRVLLPTVTKCYSQLVCSHQSQLGPLMDILKEHIGHMQRDLLASHQSELTGFFLTALNFRAQHAQDELQKAGETEGHVIDCLLAMVMKLSEVTFRPLFFKLFDWCKTEGAPKDRLITFYRLTDCVADKLKGLFLLFAGHLIKPFSDLLNQTNVTKTDEAFFDSEDNIEKSCLLLQYVLDSLHKIFLYDTQRFISKERAEALMGPLVDQLENTLGGEEEYQTRITKHLVPCIAQLSLAMGDDSQWKTLNYQILLKTRHSSPKVRYSALLLLLELASKLRENYMVLLPESIPFLAELMEDECEEVEHQVQKVIQEMEVILGEPLHSYF
ncbi:HEAT repeat-containing protein 1 [Amia ocellicauda]|uniref:HEAT repeat-containing protein 1 n=1 Tax=Amia ocellicauda TaxID=2972642 RepID=UPI003464A0E1